MNRARFAAALLCLSCTDQGTQAVVADTTAPTVRSTSPANGASGVAVTVPISATFSEAMQPPSLNVTSFAIFPHVSGTITTSATVATFVSGTPLSYSTPYTITISTAAKDAAGNALKNPYSWTFTTRAAP